MTATPATPRAARGALLCITLWALLVLAGWVTGAPLLAAVSGLALAPLPVIALRDPNRTTDLLAPIWLLCVLYAFAYLLVPLLWLLDAATIASLPGYLDMPASGFAPACLLGGAGYIALIAGYRSPTTRALADRLPTGGHASPRALLVFAIALFSAGAATVVAAYAFAGGGTLFSGDLRERVTASYSGRGYLTLGFTLLMLSVPTVTLWAARDRRRRAWIITAGLGLFALVALGGIVGSRVGVLAVLLGPAVIVHHHVRRVTPGIAGVLAALLLVAGVGQAIYRGTAELDRPLSPLGTVADTLNGHEFLANAFERVDSFEFGRPIAEDVALTYVPRALWSGKPEIFGFVREQEMLVPGLYHDSDRSATFPVGLVAEGYVNFAAFGAVGLPLLVGAIFGLVRRRSARADDDYWLLVLAALLPNTIGFLRGFGFGLIALLVALVVLAPVLLAARSTRTA